MGIVLIIDDDVAVCEGLRVVLELAGHMVQTSGNAAEAIRLVRSMDPALVVIDCNMPDMPGTRATELIRAIPNEAPIIGISAEPDREAEMRRAGVTIFLPKPLGMERFTETVARLLGEEAHESVAGQSL
jgi:DNA-binding NtrC family response regulator